MSDNRRAEEFEAAVLQDFDFLLKSGFVAHSDEPMRVRLISDLYFLNLYWDHLYEVGIEFGSTSKPHYAGSISALLSVFNWDVGVHRPTMRPAPAVAEMKQRVSSLAQDIRAYVDLAAFILPGLDEKVAANARKISDLLWPQISFEEYRARLPMLWEAGRYQEIVNLFETARKFLTVDELKMLDSAKKIVRGH